MYGSQTLPVANSSSNPSHTSMPCSSANLLPVGAQHPASTPTCMPQVAAMVSLDGAQAPALVPMEHLDPTVQHFLPITRPCNTPSQHMAVTGALCCQPAHEATDCGAVGISRELLAGMLAGYVAARPWASSCRAQTPCHNIWKSFGVLLHSESSGDIRHQASLLRQPPGCAQTACSISRPSAASYLIKITIKPPNMQTTRHGSAPKASTHSGIALHQFCSALACLLVSERACSLRAWPKSVPRCLIGVRVPSC